QMGRYAGLLAPWAIRLPQIPAAGEGLPERTRVLVSAACRWLRVAGAAAWEAGCHADDAASDTLLRAIPANIAPPRLTPRGSEPVAALCAGIGATSERLRYLAHVTTTRPRRPGTAAAESWQRTAQGAAIAGHCSELILRTLAEPASPHAMAPAAADA